MYFREGESKSRVRGRGKGSQANFPLSTEANKAWSHNPWIMTWAENESWMLHQVYHTGTPTQHFKSCGFCFVFSEMKPKQKIDHHARGLHNHYLGWVQRDRKSEPPFPQLQPKFSISFSNPPPTQRTGGTMGIHIISAHWISAEFHGTNG